MSSIYPRGEPGPWSLDDDLVALDGYFEVDDSLIEGVVTLDGIGSDWNAWFVPPTGGPKVPPWERNVERAIGRRSHPYRYMLRMNEGQDLTVNGGFTDSTLVSSTPWLADDPTVAGDGYFDPVTGAYVEGGITGDGEYTVSVPVAITYTYQGGRFNGPLSDAEITLLESLGYGDRIVYGAESPGDGWPASLIPNP